MRVLYLVHNLNDPAVAKRLLMIRAAGFDAYVAGFWRGVKPPKELAGTKVFPLCQTFDSRFLQRSIASLIHMMFPDRLLNELGPIDLVMARNLETLAIGVSISRRLGRSVPVVYEVLDIHRVLLANGLIARGLRALERSLMRDVETLLTSSPAFLREYFEPRQLGHLRPRVAIVENKPVQLGQTEELHREGEIAAGPPWRIGWLGVIRCRRSLESLCRLAERRPDLLHVQVFGRPTKEVAQDLQKWQVKTSALAFGGAYEPADLSRLYTNIHFNWAIDYYEEGGNSRWLLPNRIYEGGSFDAVPLALTGTETANWLSALGIGCLLENPETDLESFLEGLNPSRYRQLKNACRNAPRSAFIANQGDCDRLGRVLNEAAESHARARSRAANADVESMPALIGPPSEGAALNRDTLV